MTTRTVTGSRCGEADGKKDREITADTLADRSIPLPAKVPAANIVAPQRLKFVFDHKCFVSVCINDTPSTPLGGLPISGGQHEASKTTCPSLLNNSEIAVRW